MRIGRRQYGIAILDMTPMIDVVFLLLIFFLTTAQMAQMASSPVTLPEEAGNADESAGSAGMVVNVDAMGVITVLDQSIETPELMKRAKEVIAQDSAAVPVIRADRRSTAARLNEVVDALRSGGCRAVRVATTQVKEQNP
ncbi:MAG: biopolymer transporter ExbD [Planctomycetota bacterium]|nr:biopolymer transporter ExbD [Planctomycetota bacterium]